MPEVLTMTEWEQRVLEEHRQLRMKEAELREFLLEPRPESGEPGSHSWAATLSSQLAALHDELFRHFRFEDEGGMVEDISSRHPRAAQKIEEVVEDHPRMLRKLRKLTNETLEYSEGQRLADPRLRKKVNTLLDWLERHEREETDLIQRLEYRDMGAAD